MKTKTDPSKPPIFRGRMRTASILALGLLAGGAYAQSSSNPDTLQNSSSATDPARNGSYDPATSPGSSAGSDTTSTSSDRANSLGYSSRRSSDDDSSLKHGDKRFITKAAESTEREIALSQLAATRATNPQVRSYAQQLVNGHQQMEQELVQLAQQKGVTLDDVAALSTSNVSGSSSHSMAGSSGTANAGAMTDNRTANRSSANTSTDGVSDRSTASTSRTPAGSNTVADNNDATSDRHYRSLAKKSGAEFDKEYVEMMIKEHKSDVKLFQKAANDSKDHDVRSFASRQLPSLQAHLDQAHSLGQIAAE